MQLTGTARLFDEILPNIADEAKNDFIRANPQMQLGIISVVDKVAVDLVRRRPELDDYLARVWASGFTNEEMQQLIDFYQHRHRQEILRLLAEASRGGDRGRAGVGEVGGDELNQKVQAELQAAMAAESQALQSDVAGPAAETPAPQQ